MDLLQPKKIEMDGKIFILSKFPAVVGREIIAKYPISNMPKFGDYEQSKEIMLKLMNYVAVTLSEGVEVRLSTEQLINNHCESWETLIKLEAKMMEYNCSFFQNGKGLAFLKKLETFAREKITEILTHLSGNLSQGNKQHTGN